MPSLVPMEPVDYLVIGHLSCDLTPEGPRLGGTAAYAALTGLALGQRVGLVTAWAGETSLAPLDGIRVRAVPAEHSTTFSNVYTAAGRAQILHHMAPDLLPDQVPESWRAAPIVHLGPIAGEGKSLIDGALQPGLLGLTPQGWLRARSADGQVGPGPWPEAEQALGAADAAVISLEDVAGDEQQIESLASACRVLAVTEGPAGARLYWNGDLRRFRAPSVHEVDPTGAGDVFAAAFFWRLNATRDPWAAARFAAHLAAFSVTRPGLQGIPTLEEIQTCLVEVL
jgi:sugar/nucleoside kinase (ribokinase family)